MRNEAIAILVAASNLLSPAIPDVASAREPRTTTVSPPTVPIAAADETEIEPLASDERELVAWASARFALVGLDVPDVDIRFHDDTTVCGGDHGRYQSAGDRRRIDVCVADTGSFASHLHRQRTLVHELAHAWDHANLDDAGRTELLDLLGVSAWYAPDAEWDQRGVERFAETITWALYDQLRRPVLVDLSCRDLHVVFHATTGKVAPGPLEPVCDLPEPPTSISTTATHEEQS